MLRRAALNPIYARLARRRPPLLRASIAAAMLMAAVGFALAAYDLQRNARFQPLPGVRVMALPHLPDPLGGWINPILYYFSGGPSALAALVGWLIAVSAPPLAAIIAANLAASDRAESLLRLTPLDDRDVAWGYVYAALRRALPLIIIQIGVLPALIGGTWTDVLYLLRMRMLGLWPNSQNIFRMTRYGLTPLDIWGVLVVLLLISVGLVLANVLAAALGVYFSRRGRGAGAAAWAAGLAMVCTLGGAGLAWNLLVPVAQVGVAEAGPAILAGAAILYAALPVGAAVALLGRYHGQPDQQ